MMQFSKISIVTVAWLLCLSGLCSAGEFIEWESFKVKLLLKPGMPADVQPRKPYTSNVFLNNELRDSVEPNLVDQENINSYGARMMRLSISRLILNPVGKDIKEEEQKERMNQEILKVMPSLIMSGKGRESLEAIGKFFEPKVNLEIHF
jgi:hypothetical protein